MKTIRKIISAIIFLFIMNLGLTAQQVNLPAGGEATGSGGTVSYSVGQVFYHTQIETAGSVAEGVQQPYEISIITTNISAENGYELQVYPNPTSHFLTLKTGEVPGIKTNCQVFNGEGKLVMNFELLDLETQIDFSTCKPGTYYLIVREKSLVISTFKIIKN